MADISNTNLPLPMVSVITGYYNRKNGLKESVSSILIQNYPNFEYIIFDDCSTDGTYELLLEFNDPRLKIIRNEPNIGFTNGMIKAIQLARGEYIAVNGAGDHSLPNRLLLQSECLRENSFVSIVGGFFDNIDEHQQIVNRARRKSTFTRDELFDESPLSHGEVMYRKADYLAVGGYRSAFKFVQDADLWLRLSKLGNVQIIQEVIYKRIVQTEGISFHPKKAIRQSMYSLMARDINRKPDADQKIMLEKCMTDGIESVVNLKDGRFQSKILKKFHTLVYFHPPQDLADFLKISSGSRKLYYAIIIFLHRSPILKEIIFGLYTKMYKPLKAKMQNDK